MTNRGLYDEQYCLKAIAAGDERAFSRLFFAYKNKLFSVAFRMTESATLAEEIVQDVFLKIWKGRERLPEVSNFNAYLFTALRNQIITTIQTAARQPLFTSDLEMAEGAGSDAINDYITQKEYSTILHNAVNKLPAQQAQVFRLIKLEGLSRNEAAAQLGLSPATVKVHLALAMRNIRAILRLLFSIIILFLHLVYE